MLTSCAALQRVLTALDCQAALMAGHNQNSMSDAGGDHSLNSEAVQSPVCCKHGLRIMLPSAALFPFRALRISCMAAAG